MSEHKSKTHGGAGETMDHEYDGIREYDNPLPRWWVWIFWATFLFAIGYAFHYHWSGHGQGRLAVLEDETRVATELAMKLAAKEKVSEDSLAKLSANLASVTAGAAIFVARCQSCHAEKGKGLIGPNLTDGYWLHGNGKLMDIYSTVAEGVLAKGMPAWSKQLTPIELRSVVSYVGTLRGQNLPGKAPQGDAVGSAEGVTKEPNSPAPGSNEGKLEAAAKVAAMSSARASAAPSQGTPNVAAPGAASGGVATTAPSASTSTGPGAALPSAGGLRSSGGAAVGTQ